MNVWNLVAHQRYRDGLICHALPPDHVVYFLYPVRSQGILNVWNLVAYQRYYDGLIRHALPQPRGSGSSGGGGSSSSRGLGGKASEVQKQRSQQLFLEKLQDSRSSAVEVSRVELI